MFDGVTGAPIRMYSFITAPTLLGVPFGKAQAAKLIYSVLILAWLTMPWICTPEPVIEARPPLTQLLTITHAVISVLVAVLTLLSVAAKPCPE